MSPLPQSVRDLAHARPFLRGALPSPYPLRCADGRTFAQRKLDAAA